MTRQIDLDCNLKPIAYAWPGGYPVYYLAREGYRNDEGGLELSPHDREEFTCCAKCAEKAAEKEKILINCDINWESENLYCEICNEKIVSAYGNSVEDENEE